MSDFCLAVIEKDPRGSKVLERCDIVSTSEIKAGKEQLDHEVKIEVHDHGTNKTSKLCKIC